MAVRANDLRLWLAECDEEELVWIDGLELLAENETSIEIGGEPAPGKYTTEGGDRDERLRTTD